MKKILLCFLIALTSFIGTYVIKANAISATLLTGSFSATGNGENYTPHLAHTYCGTLITLPFCSKEEFTVGPVRETIDLTAVLLGIH